MAKVGRPTDYTEELARKILDRIAEGESVRSIARDESMPVASTIFKWRLEIDIFSEQYDKAKDVGLEIRAEEIEEIAEDNNIDVPRAKLITDVKRWNMSKLKPKRFGDKLDLTTGGETFNSVKELPDAELERIATGSEKGTSKA